jgi:Zn-dependent protease
MNFSGNLLADLLLWSLAFIFSTTVHEASHALVAALGGDFTAHAGGQVTLNPLPHIKREPMGMIVIPILSFLFNHGQFMIGWASAPYDPAWAMRYPRKSALMALAGPAANTLVAMISFLFLKFVLGFHIMAGFGDSGGITAVINQFFFILLELNLVLAIFNLIPFPPLDGSEIILLFFPENRANEVRHKIRSMGFFGILIAWVLFPYIFSPVASFVFSFLV